MGKQRPNTKKHSNLMPALIEYLEMADTDEKKGLLKSQWKEAVESHTVHCACGQIRAVELAYRCLYCGIWFCVPCAEFHFEMTLLEWKKKKRVERVNKTPNSEAIPATLTHSDVQTIPR